MVHSHSVAQAGYGAVCWKRNVHVENALNRAMFGAFCSMKAGLCPVVARGLADDRIKPPSLCGVRVQLCAGMLLIGS